MNKITKAVIPAGGYGTRFLPATKALPKEMLPVIDVPTIQYVVEEAVAAGIEDILIITSRSKRAIEDHFDAYPELEAALAAKNDKALPTIRRLADMANIHYIRQQHMRGLGDAILHAKHHVGNQHFAVLLGDTIHKSASPGIGQLMEVHNQQGGSVVGMEAVEADKAHLYGILAGEQMSEVLYKITEMVEKPAPGSAPSNMAVAARYVLSAGIFDALAKVPVGKGGELQLTGAMRLLLQTEPMYGLLLEGTRHDIGNKLDYIKTTIAFALARPEFAAEVKAYIKSLNI